MPFTLITPPTAKEGLYAFSASTLRSVLLTKFAVLFICRDPLAKHKKNFRSSNQN